MQGKCWVCLRHARGFGHTDIRYAVGDPKHYPLDWVFCSRRCQDIFHALYVNWVDAQKFGKAVHMVEITEVEQASQRACLRAFGEAATQIGFDKPLGAYSESEALQVIDAIVSSYSTAMRHHHAQSQYPPVRGLQSTVSDPFADLQSDLGEETP